MHLDGIRNKYNKLNIFSQFLVFLTILYKKSLS